MAPPPEFVEVRCSGCGETLEVESGLTEFACPDCGAHQALPPELMPPPPPRPRRALPLPGRGPATAVPVPISETAPAHMPCGGCGALLGVPAGFGRFACPVCGVELVIDGVRHRIHLASPSPATVSVLAPPPASAARIFQYTRRRQEADVGRHSHRIHSEEIQAQRPNLSVHREEPPSSSRTDTCTAIHNILAQKEPLNSSVYRDEPRIEPLSTTTMRSGTRKPRFQAGTESAALQMVQLEPPIQATFAPQAQATAPSYPARSDHAQGQRPVVGTASHDQQTNDVNVEPLNQDVNVERAEYQNKTTGWNLKRKRSTNDSSGDQKSKHKGSRSYPNDGLQLRRSKRFTKQPEHPINDEPSQQSAASPNDYNSDPPDIDRIIANLCPSSLPPHQMPQANSSESENVDASILLASNDGTSRVEKFPRCYNQLYPPVVSGTHQLEKSGEQVQPQPLQVMHLQQEDAHGGHLLFGSDGKSSGKHRGRRRNGATRLIASRREVDRPIVKPNIIDNWDVNPPCCKVASTITILLKQKYPGSSYLPAGQHGDVPPDGEAVYHWQQYSSEARAAILNEFLQCYKFAPGKETECLKLFDRRAARQFANLLWEEKRRVRAELASVYKAKETSGAHRSNRCMVLNDEDASEEPEDQQTAERRGDDVPLEWKPFPPAWMYPSWWERLCDHWAKEEVLVMSSQNRKNQHAGGRAFHTTGSRSFSIQRQIMVIENGGQPVSEVEVFEKTHKLNGGIGEFISERAKRTVEGFKKRMEEAAEKQLDPNLAWVQEVGGPKRGRYYGLSGTIDKAKVDELTKHIPGWFGKWGRWQKFTQGQEQVQQKFSQEQVQQMLNQALQGLNETWENKFKSLERTVRDMPLLGFHPEHAPGSTVAGGVVQEFPSRNHLIDDPSDSQHDEKHPSARHDDASDGEEVVSTSV